MHKRHGLVTFKKQFNLKGKKKKNKLPLSTIFLGES